MLVNVLRKLLFLICILAAISMLLWYATRPTPVIIQGEVSADRYDISARVSGRIASLNVDVGDHVKKGEIVALLESPELRASLETRKAELEVARADLKRVETVRPEDVAVKKADLDAANADLVLQEITYKRMARLEKSDTVSQARLDQATRNRDAALKKRDAAAAALERTVTGASQSERNLAKTKIDQAQANLESVESQIAELTVKAPINALVTTKVAEIGENFSPGAPIVSLVDMSDLWFTFNIREDYLHGLKVGDVRKVTIPALDDKVVEVRITMINVLGQFATWRATRATGDFDLRTFEVRAKPTEAVDGLRPGMTVVAGTEPEKR